MKDNAPQRSASALRTKDNAPKRSANALRTKDDSPQRSASARGKWKLYWRVIVNALAKSRIKHDIHERRRSLLAASRSLAGWLLHAFSGAEPGCHRRAAAAWFDHSGPL